jgi:hypothetical protein
MLPNVFEILVIHLSQLVPGVSVRAEQLVQFGVDRERITCL